MDDEPKRADGISDPKALEPVPIEQTTIFIPTAERDPRTAMRWRLSLGAIVACLFERAWSLSDMKPNIVLACICWGIIAICILCLFWRETPRLAKWFKLFAVITIPLILAATARPWILKQYDKQHPLIVQPRLVPWFKLMPFDPPYATGTAVAGIKFEPNTFDVRVRLAVTRASIEKLDMRIRLINTSGEMLTVRGMAQETTYHGMTISPLNMALIDPVTMIFRDQAGKAATVPGDIATDAWRVTCPELIEDSTVAFVLMVDRPARTKMIEGFILGAYYTYQTADGEKGRRREMWYVKFDGSGSPYQATQKEIEDIKSYRRPRMTISNVSITVGSNRQNGIPTSQTNKPKGP